MFLSSLWSSSSLSSSSSSLSSCHRHCYCYNNIINNSQCNGYHPHCYHDNRHHQHRPRWQDEDEGEADNKVNLSQSARRSFTQKPYQQHSKYRSCDRKHKLNLGKICIWLDVKIYDIVCKYFIQNTIYKYIKLKKNINKNNCIYKTP